MPINPVIAISMGDPRGIGPEVAVKAIAALHDSAASFRIFGIPDQLSRIAVSASLTRWDRNVIEIVPLGFSDDSTRTEACAGEASFRWVEAATHAALGKRNGTNIGSDLAHAVVTAPISKAAWAAAGHAAFPGHTELLASLCGVAAGQFGMMFHVAPTLTAPGINVILATVHVPLAKVPSLVTRERVFDTIRLAARGMSEVGVADPRIAVCGLNPHAGEGGLLGHEDEAEIAPAIADAVKIGLEASGPFPADTIFRRALAGLHRRAEFDCVVAMYHDQGLAPIKTMAMERAVNRTVGLPIIRTSPDHGTAMDIVGLNTADAGSMTEALRLAIQLATQAS